MGKADVVLTTEAPGAFGSPREGPGTARARRGERRGSFPFIDWLKPSLHPT